MASGAYSFTPIDQSSAGQTLPLGINDAGQIVGTLDSDGFILSNGQYTTISDPKNQEGTGANGINSSGEIVGYYDTDNGESPFMFENGVYTTLETSSQASDIVANGINDSGQVVGDTYDGDDFHGFLISGGNTQSIDDPEAQANGDTTATGINDSSQIVGYYGDNNGTLHGFLLTPAFSRQLITRVRPQRWPKGSMPRVKSLANISPRSKTALPAGRHMVFSIPTESLLQSTFRPPGEQARSPMALTTPGRSWVTTPMRGVIITAFWLATHQGSP